MDWRKGKYSDGRIVYFYEVDVEYTLRVYQDARNRALWVWDITGPLRPGRAPMAHRAESVEDGQIKALAFWERFHAPTQTGLWLDFDNAMEAIFS